MARTLQPQGAVRIAERFCKHPRHGVWLPSLGWRVLNDGGSMSLSQSNQNFSGNRFVPTSQGIAARAYADHGGNDDDRFLWPSSVPTASAGSLTSIFVFYAIGSINGSSQVSSTLDQGHVCTLYSGGSIELGYNGQNGYVYKGEVTPPFSVTNNWVTAVISTTRGRGTWAANGYVFGATSGQESYCGEGSLSATGQPFIGSWDYSNYYHFNGYIALWAHLPNVLCTEQEVRSLSINPWQLFAPQRRPFIFFGPAAGGTTTTESVSSRLRARGSETSTPIRVEVATSRRKARGAATVTAIKDEAVVGRRKARGAATTTIALRTESSVGRVKARGTTTVTHIDAGAVVESVAGRRKVRASVATTPIRIEAVVARRQARGSDTVTLTRTEAVVARRKARGAANAAPLVAGMITESVASRLSVRASSTTTTTRIEAVTARRQARGTAIINGIREALAAGRRRLRGAAAAAPYVAPTLPVEIPESSRTVNAQEVRIGASPTRKASPRLG